MTHAKPHPPAEQGMILINVLVIVTLASAVLAIMLAGQDTHSDRTVLLRSAAQAQAIARGGELSAVTALRRDLASGSTSDFLTEPWANIADQDAEIEGGRFTYAVIDAQSRFNINSLTRNDVSSRATFALIAQQAGMPVDSVERVAAMLQVLGPVENLADLQVLGFSDAQLQALTAYCSLLPTPTDVNINTAPEGLIAIMLGNPVAAASLVTTRKRFGDLSPATLSTAGVVLPAGLAFSSEYFWSRGEVTMGRTTQRLTSLLHRQTLEGVPQVAAIRRWRGRAPAHAPPLTG